MILIRNILTVNGRSEFRWSGLSDHFGLERRDPSITGTKMLSSKNRGVSARRLSFRWSRNSNIFSDQSYSLAGTNLS